MGRALTMVVALGLASPAWPQDLPASFDAATQKALRAVLDRATSRGLPVAPLLAKAFEGAAKRVPPPRVVAVVAELGERLETARALLVQARLKPNDAAITAAADGLGAGMARGDLAPIAALGARLGLTPEATVSRAAGLTVRGVPSALAREAVEALATVGKDAVARVELGRTVERLALRTGLDVAGATRVLMAELRQSGRVDGLEDRASSRAGSMHERMAPGEKGGCMPGSGPAQEMQFGKHPAGMPHGSMPPGSGGMPQGSMMPQSGGKMR